MVFVPSSYRSCNGERVTVLVLVVLVELSPPSSRARSSMASLFSSAFDDLLVSLCVVPAVLDPLWLFSFLPLSSLSFDCPFWDAMSKSGSYIRKSSLACVSVGLNSGLHVFMSAMCSLRSQRHKWYCACVPQRVTCDWWALPRFPASSGVITDGEWTRPLPLIQNGYSTNFLATGRFCDRDAYTLQVNFTLFLRYLRPLYAFTPATGSYFVVSHYTYQEERKIGYVNNNTSDHPRVYSHNEEGTRTQSSCGICGGGQVRERRFGPVSACWDNLCPFVEHGWWVCCCHHHFLTQAEVTVWVINYDSLSWLKRMIKNSLSSLVAMIIDVKGAILFLG